MSSERKDVTGLVLAVGGAGIAAMAGYWLWLRPRHQRWGATDMEVSRVMAGDDLVPQAAHVTTRAVTIDARPEDVWAWLVQMGYGRAGMYSYDWVDRAMGILDEESSRRILPEHQHLAVGDVIPMGSGPSWPVTAVEPNRSLVLHIQQPGVDITWSYLLEELGRGRTRLVLRIRTWLPLTPQLAPLMALMDPGEFLMVRKHLLGIKERAEGLSRQT